MCFRVRPENETLVAVGPLTAEGRVGRRGAGSDRDRGSDRTTGAQGEIPGEGTRPSDSTRAREEPPGRGAQSEVKTTTAWDLRGSWRGVSGSGTETQCWTHRVHVLRGRTYCTVRGTSLGEPSPSTIESRSRLCLDTLYCDYSVTTLGVQGAEWTSERLGVTSLSSVLRGGWGPKLFRRTVIVRVASRRPAPVPKTYPSSTTSSRDPLRVPVSTRPC